MTLTLKKILCIAAAIAALDLAPFLFTNGPSGDVIFHYTLINCFSSQWWQGDLYPRWCIDAGAGLGAPQFLFYFPLPYYVTSLFYPLHFLGITVQQLYLLSLWLASAVTLVTCWLWLKEIVSPGRALLAAILFLLMPYRMELMFYRSAFAEVWGMALLPLLFLFTRRLALGDDKNWIWLSCAFAASLLTHIPLTIAGLMACGIQLLWFSGRQVKPKCYFALAVILAGMVAAFYILPAKYFTQHLYPEMAEIVRITWANSYITRETFSAVDPDGATDYHIKHGHIRTMVGACLTMVFTLGLAGFIFKGKARIGASVIQREIKAWACIAALAAFLLFEISDPVWRLLGTFSIVAFPWRMQSLVMCAAIYFIAVKMQWLTTQKQLQTWRADYGISIFLLGLIGLFVLTTPASGSMDVFRSYVQRHMIQAPVYRSRWTDKEAYKFESMVAIADNPAPRAQLIKGQGKVTEESWDWRGIVLHSDMPKGGAVRLKHFYFPVWQLSIDGKAANENLTPEEHSGLMLVQAPPGKHVLELRTDVGAAMGWRYTQAKIASWLGAAILALLLAWRAAPSALRNKLSRRPR